MACMVCARVRLGMVVRALAGAAALSALAAPAKAHGRASDESVAATAFAKYVPVLHEGDALPDVAFLDQRARPVRLQAFRGSALVLSFIYTRCADAQMCPLVSAKFMRLQHAIGRERIHLLEVTLDPHYDTPSVLAHYAALFAADPARWTLATGSPAEVAELAARVGITEVPAGGSNVHSEAAVVVAPDGRIARIIDGNEWTADQVLSEARAALGAQPNVLVRATLWLAAGVAAACGGARSGISVGAALVLFLGLAVAAAFVVKRVFRSLLT